MSYGLFDVFGVELEYMIVDRDSHKIRPIADLIFKECTGTFTSDFENGSVAWSNELVSHVVEIKTNGPVKNMGPMSADFHENVKQINEILAKHNAVLMPGGAHLTADPLTETQIWPHEHNEIYELYNRIFNCKGHGWSNLQSTHINLPFRGDEEFAKLHAAIRVLLPIIPALTTSTPILDGKLSGFKDTRLEYYRKNQAKIPVIAGKVIPEAVYSKDAYYQEVFKPIQDAIRPYDTHGILDHHFLNSRGAIARFDRGAIEIRIIDNQECPKMDIAILNLIVAELKRICNLSGQEMVAVQGQDTEALSQDFLKVIKDGENASLSRQDYLAIFGLEGTLTTREIWKDILERHQGNLGKDDFSTLKKLLEHGTLSTRMEKIFEQNPNEKGIAEINRRMINALATNEMLVV